MKSILAVALIILFSLSLAGCKGGSDLFAGIGGDGGSSPYSSGSSFTSGGSSGGDDGASGSHSPEPSTLALLGLGGIATLLGRKLKNRKK